MWHTVSRNGGCNPQSPFPTGLGAQAVFELVLKFSPLCGWTETLPASCQPWADKPPAFHPFL